MGIRERIRTGHHLAEMETQYAAVSPRAPEGVRSDATETELGGKEGKST